MGLTIFYSGRFREDRKLKDMIEEVEEIVAVNEWDCTIFSEEFEQRGLNETPADNCLYGIMFTPLGSEPIQLTFASDKRMCSCFEFSSPSGIARQMYYSIFSKTQYAGVEAHKIIIDLLRYLSAKYFSEFKLIDESHYWETNDENVLRENFRKYETVMNILAGTLDEIVPVENEPPKRLSKRIMDHLRRKRNRMIRN